MSKRFFARAVRYLARAWYRCRMVKQGVDLVGSDTRERALTAIHSFSSRTLETKEVRCTILRKESFTSRASDTATLPGIRMLSSSACRLEGYCRKLFDFRLVCPRH